MTKKTLLFAAILACASTLGWSQKKEYGYKVTVEFDEPIKDQTIYLAHYFGKGLPTIYKLDSAKVINGRKAEFQRKDSILGGLHLVMYEQNSRFFHLLLDNGYKVSAKVDTSGKAHFTQNQINKDFELAEEKMLVIQKDKAKLREDYKNASSKEDSTRIDAAFKELVAKEKAIRREYAAKNKGNLMAKIFDAMDAPDLPTDTRYLEDGVTVDSLYPLMYYKQHFWDKFDFTDNRLVKTSLLDGRLGEYFNNLVYPIPDSINYEMDKLLAKAEPAKEIYKYILHWLGNWTHENKMMGVDASFVYLVENYYGKGKAFWLDSAAVAKYLDRAGKIAPNVVGNPAPRLVLQNLATLQDVDVTQATKSRYTIIAFWSADCGHCMEEMPKVVDLYNKILKKMDVQVISVPLMVKGGDDIRKIYEEWGVNDWITLVDYHNKKEYRELYDAYATPVIYVLDRDKIIVGKKLGSSSILPVIEHDIEVKNKKAAKP